MEFKEKVNSGGQIKLKLLQLQTRFFRLEAVMQCRGYLTSLDTYLICLCDIELTVSVAFAIDMTGIAIYS